MAFSADTVTSADVGIATDDNITSARDGSKRTTEQALQLGLVHAVSSSVNHGMSLRLLARANGRFHARYEGLNEFSGGLDGQLLLRPGSGFHTPTLGFSLGAGTNQFASKLRDANEARSKVFIQQALTTKLSSRAAVFSVWRDSNSRAFDADWRGGELSLDWQIQDRLRLSMGYQYRDGTVVSVGLPGAAAVAHSTGLAADDVFTGLTAFGFDAQTHIGSATVSYALTPNLLLESQARYVESDTDFDTRYHRWNTSCGLVLRF